MTSNIPEYYKDVSLRLNRVLDTVGLGEDIRWKRINMWIQLEEVLSVPLRGRIHYFGSQAEATTTPGLQSDIDVVHCMRCRAIKDLESWMPGIPTVLIVSDENTPPGYVKLQEVNIDQPWPAYNEYNEYNELFKLDRFGRSVFCNDNGLVKHHDCTHHGPANVSYEGESTTDNVYGIRLHAWPDQASQWLTRNRRHNWPSHQTIRLIQETGALLVPVGHKLSQENHLEWRISISYGEKLLMWLFNSTQYKCYILLKMINKSFIKPSVCAEALSSYHCKTCIFYLIENTPTAIWQPDNLLSCVELSLRLLYNWTESKICPNYFIPEENMFQCKIYGHVQDQLFGVLGNLLRQEGRYLLGISCDNIGQKLMRTCQIPLMELELQSQDVTEILMTSVSYLFWSLLNAVGCYLEDDLIFENYQLDTYFSSHVAVGCDLANNLIYETHQLDRHFPSYEPRREIHTILLKLHCSIIGSKLASKSLSLETTDQNSLDVAHELLLWGSSIDVAFGKLKLAAFYLVQNNLGMSKDVLSEIHTNYNYKISGTFIVSQHTLQAILSENLSTTQLISQYFALPVLYHSSEINCTPKALIPYMFCPIELDQGNKYKDNFVLVDPELYLYFLEFLCYFRQNNMSHKKAALDNIIYFIRHKRSLFKVTALNLLAYCLTQEGRLTNAYRILCKSMKLKKKKYKGAKWQIATLINAAFRFRSGGQ